MHVHALQGVAGLHSLSEGLGMSNGAGCGHSVHPLLLLLLLLLLQFLPL